MSSRSLSALLLSALGTVGVVAGWRAAPDGPSEASAASDRSVQVDGPLGGTGGSSSEDEATGTSNIYSMAMHLHGAASEGTAQWNWHIAQALANNIDVLWWSEHDTFLYPDGVPNATGFDFEAGGLSNSVATYPSTATPLTGLLRDNTENLPLAYGLEALPAAAFSGSYGGRFSMAAHDDATDELVEFFYNIAPKVHYKALMGDVTFEFRVRPNVASTDGELQVLLPLNGTPVTGTRPVNDSYKRIIFYHGGAGHTPGLQADGYTYYVPMALTEGEWTTVSANISDLAADAWPTEWEQLHAEMFTLRGVASNGAEIEYDLDDFAWDMAIHGDDLASDIEAYVSSLSTDPVNLVGIEISEVDGGHFSTFGSGIPLLPYATDDAIDPIVASDWVHAYGGLISVNHLFGPYGGVWDEDTRAAQVEETITNLASNDAYGADMLEIGYRERGGQMSDFLEVWDELGRLGVYKTGIAGMDLHDNDDFATFTNNFVTYVQMTGDFDEATALSRLAVGRTWFADPTMFRNGKTNLSISASTVSAQQGDVVVGRSRPLSVSLSISSLPTRQCTVRLVQNGSVTNTWNPTCDGRRWSTSVNVNPVGGKVVRMEVVQRSSRNPVGYTNPIYFVDSDPGTIPADRKIRAF